MNRMADKTAPLGVCDLCGGSIPSGSWYTKQKPRRFCSVVCRNTWISRNHAVPRNREIKLREIEEGRWQNPHLANPPSPEEQGRRARIGRLKEVQAGTWRNPALADEAREKLSRPRTLDPILSDAISRQDRYGTASLTDEEKSLVRAHRRKVAQKKREG